MTDAVPLIVHIRESSEVKWLISETLACVSDQSLGYVGVHSVLPFNPDSADVHIQGDSKLLSVFPWPINGNPDSNLESHCIIIFLRWQICKESR
jgi:hypothetical protein